MAYAVRDDIITVIDAGSTKIIVLIARVTQGMQYEIIGVGRSPSHGIHRGVIVDIGHAMRSLTKAIREAEAEAGVAVRSASVSISGSHIISLSSSGTIPVKSGIVQASDVVRAVEAAQAVAIPEGKQILHIIPQVFVIDGKEVGDPVSMHGIRLEVKTHIILGNISAAQDLGACCKQLGILARTIVPTPLASAEAVLSSDEKYLGVAILDIGGGAAHFAHYVFGSVRHTAYLPIAGSHFTHDLAIGLRISLAEAERIKKEHGSVIQMTSQEEDYPIEVEMIHGKDRHTIVRSDIHKILLPRAKELLEMVHDEMKANNLLSSLTAGIVLTGGGALLCGLKELAEKVFGCPVRIGTPHQAVTKTMLQDTTSATVCGLLLYALQSEQNKDRDLNAKSFGSRVRDRVKFFINDFLS
jgi:cell division protein FtsA